MTEEDVKDEAELLKQIEEEGSRDAEMMAAF